MIYGKDNVAMPQDMNKTALPENAIPQIQSTAKESNATQITNEKKPVNSKTYYMLVSVYGIFFAFIALIIILAPQSWLSIPVLASIMKAMISEMPGLVYLAGLSKSPEDTAAALFLPFLTAPVHFVFLTTMAMSRNNNGFYDPIKFWKIVKWGWIFIAASWGLFFSCVFCFDEPNWRDYVWVSSRGFIAIFQQTSVALAVAYPAIIVARLFACFNINKLNSLSGGRSHGE